jgi:hypothetical protein
MIRPGARMGHGGITPRDVCRCISRQSFRLHEREDMDARQSRLVVDASRRGVHRLPRIG